MPEQPLTHVIEFDPEDEYRPEPEPEPVPLTWMDGSLRIGIHTSIAGGYSNALESAHKLGCNALQIFSASPRMWAGGPSRIPEVDATAFRARRHRISQASGKKSAGNFAAHFARKHRWHGHCARRAPGRNRRDAKRAAKPASRRVPRHRASVRRWLRHKKRNRPRLHS